VAAGLQFSLGITTAGALYAWGNNTYGQLAQGAQALFNRSSPVQIGSSSWTLVAAGVSHAAAIDINGRLFTWGYNGGSGALGDGTTISKSSPVQIGSSSWTFISLNSFNSAAITTAGALYTWGSGGVGQLGDGTTIAKSSPVQIGSSSWSTVSVGLTHIAAIDTTGALYTWGFNNSAGNLGDGTVISKSSPVKIGSSSWSKVSAGSSHTVGLLNASGNFFQAWGANDNGQLGDGTTISKSVPTTVSSFANPINLIASHNSTFGISSDVSNLYAWGDNTFAQTGLPAYFGAYNTSPSLVYTTWNIGSNPKSWTLVSAGNSYIAAIDTTGALYTWGLNSFGNLGDGTIKSKLSPVKIGSSSWSAVSAGNWFSMAIDTTGILYTWGYNALGQLGDGTTTYKSSPVQIGTSSWSKVSAGNNYSSAIDITGALYTWGLNSTGQLGDGTTVNKSSPVQIGSSSWTSVSTCKETSHTAALTSNNKLFTWGVNNNGQIGDGTFFSRSSPVQIGTSSWSLVTTGGNQTVAVEYFGNLYTWGLNNNGQLGNNTTTTKSTPTQIALDQSDTTVSWSAVSSGLNHMIAKDTSRALWSWGNNANGQLGLGNAINAPTLQLVNNYKYLNNIYAGGNFTIKQ
jgi:alpha-tubulin suppressor-like RCC1 family protein